MRDSRAHVEASGRRPEGRLRAAVRHRRRGRVRDQPPASAAAARPLPGRRARGPRAAIPSTTHQPGRTPDAVRDRIVALRPSSPPGASTPARSRSPGTSDARATGPVDLDHPAHPPRRRPGRPRAPQAPAQLVDPVRGRPAQRVLAVRLHPLAPGRRHRGRDPQLARRPLPLPARLHRLPAGHRRRRGGHVHGGRRAHGWPAATLTDNGAVYTSRFTGGRNGFEYLLASLGIRQKNGAPATPRPRARSSASTRPSSAGSARSHPPRPSPTLQAQLDAFRALYNEQRPHRAIGRATPGEAYRATPRPLPAGPAGPGHFRLRYDPLDTSGTITLRRAGRLHHLKVGAAHARTARPRHRRRHEVTVVALDTGEILSTHLIEPDQGYWRNTRRDPGRWPGRSLTVSPMSRLMCHLCRDSSHWRARRDSNPKPSDP